MKEIIKIIAALIIIQNCSFSFGQSGNNMNNKVPNSSFEEAATPYSNPNALGQINRCADWGKVNTPDWFDDEAFPPPNTPPINAHTGTGFAGIYQCEGVKVKLENKLPANQYVTVGLWFSPGQSFNSEMNVYLKKNQSDDGNFGSCDEPLSDAEVHFTVPVNAGFPDPVHEIGKWYFWESPPFLIESEGWTTDIDWLFIRGDEIPLPPDDANAYFYYLDDVSVKIFTPCAHKCTKQFDEPIQITGIAGVVYDASSVISLFDVQYNISGTECNVCFDPISFSLLEFDEIYPPAEIVLIPNSNASVFQYLIKNAHRVQFEVRRPSGGNNPVYYIDLYDYESGLHDVLDGVIYDDFLFVWNGQKNDGSPAGTDTYNYSLLVTSCDFTNVLINGTVDVQGNDDAPPNDVEFNNQNNYIDNEDCCDDFVTIQYFVYTPSEGWYREDAEDYVLAGGDVANGTTNPVIVQLDAKVAYYAQNEVKLEPGFTANNGAEFKAELHACGAIGKSNPGAIRNGKQRTIPTATVIGQKKRIFDVEDQLLSLSPNPADQLINLQSKAGIRAVSIVSVTGVVMKRMNVKPISFNVELDVKDFPKGVYVVICDTDEGVLRNEFVKM